MGVSQKRGDRQVQRAAGQAVTAAATGLGVDRFPPVAGPVDQVVALLGKGLQTMADGQVAQTQHLGDRHLIGAGQAGAALTTTLGTQARPTSGLQACQGLALRWVEPGPRIRERPGDAARQVLVAGSGGTQRQG